MVKFKKKEKVAVFKSAFGANIKLDILIKDNILKITVFKSINSEICKSIILMIMVLCNLLSTILTILNIKLATAIFIVIFFDLFRLCTTVKEEILVAIKGVGFQVTTKYLLGVKTVFIPREQVQKIFINEVIVRNRVIYVLSLLTKDTQMEGKLVPLFLGTIPRLASLKIMYKHLQNNSRIVNL